MKQKQNTIQKKRWCWFEKQPNRISRGKMWSWHKNSRLRPQLSTVMGFPVSSDGKASACNVGDWSSISGSGRSPGEGNSNPLQYSWLENPMDGEAWKAAVRKVTEGQTRLSEFTFTVHFHALEKEMATHSSVLAWRIPGTGEPGGLPSMGSHRVGHDWSDLAAAAAAVLYYSLCLFVPKVFII